jgi:outer membrane protein assembly factor BamB
MMRVHHNRPCYPPAVRALLALLVLAGGCRSRDGEFWERPDAARRDGGGGPDLAGTTDFSFPIDVDLGFPPDDMAAPLDFAGPPVDLAVPPHKGWPMARHDGQGRGRSDFPGPAMPARLWQVAIKASAPVVGPDGTVAVFDANLAAADVFDRAGNLKVSFAGYAPLAFSSNGILFLGGIPGKAANVLAVDTINNFTKKWNAPVSGAVTAAVVGADDTLYTYETGFQVSALANNGNLWTFRTGTNSGALALGADGAILVYDFVVVQVLERNGQPRWARKDIRLPVARPDGVLLALDLNGGQLLELDPKDGHTIVARPLPLPAIDAPAQAPDGSYRWNGKQGTGASTPELKPLWIFPLPNGDTVSTALTVDSVGNTYFGTSLGRYYSIDPQGNPRWSADFPGPLDTRELVLDGTSLYIGTINGLFAVGK